MKSQRRFRIIVPALALMLLPATALLAVGSKETTNRAVAERWVREVVGEGNFALIPDLVQPDLVIHEPPTSPGIPVGIDGITGFLAGARSAHSDQSIEDHNIWTDGDFVISLWTETRTHDLGDNLGYAPTGETHSYDGMTVYRLENGKIAEIWLLYDSRPFYRSVGVLPKE